MSLTASRFHARLGTFRQLEIFIKFAETGSISQTSKELHLAQPSVSIQIKKLADNLGVTLVEQIGRKLYLTEAGEELYKSSLEIFDSVSRLESRLSSLSGLQSGKLKLSVVTTAKYFFPHLLGPFCKKYPKIDVSFNIGNRGTIIQRLQNNLDDFYVFSFPPEDIDIIKNEFIENPLVVVAPVDHPLAGKRNIPFSSLKDEPFIMREPGSGTRHSVEKYLRDTENQINEKMTIESNEAIKHSVMSELGISILSVHTLFQERNDKITILDVKDFPMQHKWYIVHLREKQLSDVAKTFLQFLNIDGAIIARQLLIDSETTKFIKAY
ncbi:LysR family transcriptional regulator [Pleionea sp. CnH1-48]|uniref:LysR family transcriptional regulator n=1 Tax=Pleionea sp. CnH1-48 TaxID=2954494 RepID=UPI002096FBFA|nr:LysR family transcriptional regulator [Pleionea sp. CnH1-48]MCO7223015.1 LysR family transcriptional regulator [Pleionea sp. CnH1-48]